MKLFNYVVEPSLNSRRPWSHIRNHKHGGWSHFIWGKISVVYGQPHLVEIEVHRDCNGEVGGLGEDYISYCTECETIVEGDTEYITMEEYEARIG